MPSIADGDASEDDGDGDNDGDNRNGDGKWGLKEKSGMTPGDRENKTQIEYIQMVLCFCRI